jgi:hypothetical protein
MLESFSPVTLAWSALATAMRIIRILPRARAGGDVNLHPLADGVRTSDGHITAQISEKNRLIRWGPYSPLLLALANDRAKIFRASDGRQEVDLEISGVAKDTIWSSDVARVLVITADGLVNICDAASGKQVITWRLEEPNYKSLD